VIEHKKLARTRGPQPRYLTSLEREVIDAAIAMVSCEIESERLRLEVSYNEHDRADRSSEEWKRYVEYSNANGHVCKDLRNVVKRLIEEREKR
jgi:hypothetical protein